MDINFIIIFFFVKNKQNKKNIYNKNQIVLVIVIRSFNSLKNKNGKN